jgi:hypothetical protein
VLRRVITLTVLANELFPPTLRSIERFARTASVHRIHHPLRRKFSEMRSGLLFGFVTCITRFDFRNSGFRNDIAIMSDRATWVVPVRRSFHNTEQVVLRAREPTSSALAMMRISCTEGLATPGFCSALHSFFFFFGHTSMPAVVEQFHQATKSTWCP